MMGNYGLNGLPTLNESIQRNYTLIFERGVLINDYDDFYYIKTLSTSQIARTRPSEQNRASQASCVRAYNYTSQCSINAHIII